VRQLAVPLALVLAAASVHAQERARPEQALDARRVQRVRLAHWEHVPAPDGLPLPLAGHVVGLLQAGYTRGWGQTESAVMSRGAYMFSVDRSMPFWVYFPTDDGEQAHSPYSVTLPDGSPFETPVASMLRPGAPNDRGLSEIGHLVELEVNGGAGSREGHFVATAVRVLDGTPEIPMQTGQVLLALQARIDRLLARDGRAFERARRQGTVEQEERVVTGTWDAAAHTLESVFRWELLVRREGERVVVETDRCPPCPCQNGVCAPCARCLPVDHTYRIDEQREVEMAVVQVVDAQGRLLRETVLAPRTTVTQARTELGGPGPRGATGAR
jgi:hypothetical protein